MDPDFWHELWAQGKIGFHQHDFNDHMQAFTGETVGQRAADAARGAWDQHGVALADFHAGLHALGGGVATLEGGQFGVGQVALDHLEKGDLNDQAIALAHRALGGDGLLERRVGPPRDIEGLDRVGAALG